MRKEKLIRYHYNLRKYIFVTYNIFRNQLLYPHYSFTNKIVLSIKKKGRELDRRFYFHFCIFLRICCINTYLLHNIHMYVKNK